MSELFDKWEDDIKKYCEINNLSFEKAKNMAKCWGKDDLILQYYDSSKNRLNVNSCGEESEWKNHTY